MPIVFASSLVQHAHGSGPSGPPPGVPLLPTAALYLAVAVAGLLLAPALTRVEARSWWRVTVLGLVGAAYAVATGLRAAHGDVGVGAAAAIVAVALAGVGCAARRG